MDLKEEDAIDGDPRAHWYYISKGRAIKSLLGPRPIETLLDVGAGSGVFSTMLTGEGRAERAICVDPNYEDEFVGRRRDDAVSYVRSVDDVDADTVLMIDVIEHVDDDVALIRDYAARARPGTRFVISAPAFQFLWSSHDEALDHRRRYRLADVERVVAQAGLAPRRSRYFFGILFPAAAAISAAERARGNAAAAQASRLKPAPAWLNQSLVAIHDVERLTLFPFNRFAGVSAMCLAEKPARLAQSKAAA